MIRVNNNFSFHRDKYQWILCQYIAGKDKDGNPKQQCRQTYHANIPQVATKILELSSGECSSMDGLITLYTNAVELLTEELEAVAEEVSDV